MPGKYLRFTDELYAYMLEQRTNADDPLLEALWTETESLGDISRMSISPDQASFMTLITALIGAKWAVEVGTFTGTSSIAISRGLVPGGKLFCFDMEFKWTSIARRYWMRAGVVDKIDLRLGDARQLLRTFRPQAPLDLVFIDADKESYDIYYELLLPHVRVGGLIIFDNMFGGGDVINPEQKFTPANRAIDQLNHKLAADKRIHSVLISIADGLHLCRKRAGADIA